MKKNHLRVAIIGGGHIGQALALGLLAGKSVSASQLTISNPHLEELKYMKEKHKMRITNNNKEAVRSAHIIFLTVKAKMVKEVICEVKNSLRKDALLISCAACITFKQLETYLQGKSQKMVRIMPNISIRYGRGVVGFIGNKQIDKKDEELIKNLLSHLGEAIECRNEKMLDKLTLISGCGPGLVGYVMRHFEEIAKTYGFSQSQTQAIVAATFSGTLYHLQATRLTTQDLITHVATKGGITQEIIQELEENNFSLLLAKSIEKGYAKMNNIRKELIHGNDR